jgi:hypothetical protein
MSLLQSLGRAVTRAGSSRSAIIATAAIAGTAGMVSNTSGAVLDAANEAAFSDPNTDRYFLGERGLSPGTMLDASLGSGAAVAGTGIGAAVGAAGGAMLGAGIGGMLKDSKFANDINVPNKFAEGLPLIGGKKVPLIGGENLFKGGVGGRGKILMAGLGLAAGGALGASTYTASHINRNRDFYTQSPYSRGSAMQASSTQAYGDMVLGMHNTRRG